MSRDGSWAGTMVLDMTVTPVLPPRTVTMTPVSGVAVVPVEPVAEPVRAASSCSTVPMTVTPGLRVTFCEGAAVLEVEPGSPFSYRIVGAVPAVETRPFRRAGLWLTLAWATVWR